MVVSCGVVLPMPLTLRWSAMFNNSHLLVWLWMLQFQLCLNSQLLYILEGDRTTSLHQHRYSRSMIKGLHWFLSLWRLKLSPHHLFMLSTMTVMKRCRVSTRYVLMVRDWPPPPLREGGAFLSRVFSHLLRVSASVQLPLQALIEMYPSSSG